MKLTLVKDTTSKRILIFIGDSTSGAEAGLTGLAWNSSGLKWTVAREDDGNAAGTAVTLATMTRGTWATGGFVEKDSTLMPGFYEIGIPNAMLASGSQWAVMELHGATNMIPVKIEIQLSGTDDQNATTGGLGNLDAAVASRSTYAGADTSRHDHAAFQAHKRPSHQSGQPGRRHQHAIHLCRSGHLGNDDVAFAHYKPAGDESGQPGCRR